MKQCLSAVLAIVSLAACGSGSSSGSGPITGAALCNKASDVGNAVTTKLAACVPNAGATIPSGSTCTTQLASCSAADQAILNNVLDCINGALPSAPVPSDQCGASTFTNLVTQLNTCTDSSHTGNLSAACTAALDLGGSSSGALGNGSCTYAATGAGGVCVQFVGQDMTAPLCSLFNQQGLTFSYSASACAANVGGYGKLGTCTLSSSGLTTKMAIYGPSASAAATQCTSQGGQWSAGT